MRNEFDDKRGVHYEHYYTFGLGGFVMCICLLRTKEKQSAKVRPGWECI